MAGRAGKAINRSTAFWDTSILLPLCVRQSATAKASTLYKKYEMVVWWGAPVEIANILARLVRLHHIDSKGWTAAWKLAKSLSESWAMMQPSEALRSRAIRLVDRYDLSAGSALQLAAALEWCEGIPQERVFLTLDKQLREAALLCDFNALQI